MTLNVNLESTGCLGAVGESELQERGSFPRRFRPIRGGKGQRIGPVLALLGMLFGGSESARATEAPPVKGDEASAYFDAGNEAFARGATHEAYRQYRLAWQLNQAFDVACNLGRTEAELGKLVDAVKHLDFCLANFSASPQPELKSARARYAELRQTVRAQVAALRFRVDPPASEITLDGALLSGLSSDEAVYLRPGEHVLEARLPGYQVLRREIVAHAGETRTLELSLVPETTQPEARSAASTPQSPASAGGSVRLPSTFDQRRTLSLTGAALTLVGAGVGLGFYLQGRKLDDEAASIRTAISEDSGGEPCLGQASPSCAQLSDTIDRRDTAVRYSSFGFVAMGVLGVGTLAVWQWWPSESQRAASGASAPGWALGRTQVVPWANLRGAGVSFSGTISSAE